MSPKKLPPPPDDTKNLQLIGNTWYIRARVKGATIKQTLRTSSLAVAQSRRDGILRGLRAPQDERHLLQQVQRQLAGITAEEESAANRADKGLLLADAFARWERDPSRRQATKRQVQSHRANWRSFLDWMQANYPAVKYCRQMTREIGREWIADLYSRVKTLASYNKYLITTRYVFSVASQYDDKIVNPLTGVQSKKESDAISKEPFTPEQLRKVFSTADREFRRLCAVGLYTTLRLSDAVSLRWDALSADLKYLAAVHRKTGADASMRVPEPLREVLAEVPPEERTGLVCPRYAGYTKNGLSYNIMRSLETVGIQTRREVAGLNGLRRVACIKGFHSFRHTAITMALAAGKTSSQVRRLAGHATEAMQRRYTHLDADTAGDAADAIGKFW